MNIKSKIAFLISVFVGASLLWIPSAHAGQLSALGATVSWEDKQIFSPSGTKACTRPVFHYANSASSVYMVISLQNSAGIGLDISGALEGTGQTTFLLCDSKQDFTGTLLFLKVVPKSGGDQIVSTPITLLPVAQASTNPQPTALATATPQPAPTVTVTATPQPAPTVTVTATPATGALDNFYKFTEMQDLYNKAAAQVNILTAKIAKICKNKPKPKGC